MRAPKLFLFCLTVLLICPSIAWSQPRLIEEETVAEWRSIRNAKGGYTYGIGYAAGAMASLGALIDCNQASSVGELEAYLAHTADPNTKTSAAVMTFFGNRGCQFSESVIRAILKKRETY